MSISIDNPPTINWTGQEIEIIDQTLLPDELKVIRLKSVEDVVDAIKRLAIRGAPAIGACGAYGVVVAIDQITTNEVTQVINEMNEAAEIIGETRPTAVNLSYAVERVKKVAVGGKSKEQIRELALTEANKIFAEDRDACDSIGRYGAEELSAYTNLMTHCNAGRLATTGIGTALGVIYGKALAGQAVAVFASETRPLLQGARLTAWELSNAGIDVTVIPDSSACSLMTSGRVDAVVVGADRIATNGDAANKIGTFTHAVSAHNAGIPFYVAAPTSTFDPETSNGQDIKIEQRDPNEVRGVEKLNVPTEGVEIWNPAFDVTPAELITGIVTEYGVLRSDYSKSIEDLLSKASL